MKINLIFKDIKSLSPSYKSISTMVDAQPLTFSSYPFLAELGLTESNLGVYHTGTWSGAGPSYTAVSPHDNKPIARITMGTPEDYEACIAAM